MVMELDKGCESIVVKLDAIIFGLANFVADKIPIIIGFIVLTGFSTK